MSTAFSRFMPTAMPAGTVRASRASTCNGARRDDGRGDMSGPTRERRWTRADREGGPVRFGKRRREGSLPEKESREGGGTFQKKCRRAGGVSPPRRRDVSE